MKTILIAEDDETHLDMYSKKLELSGFTVVKTNNGRTAYDNSKKIKPDALILDIGLPEFDGLTVLEMIRNLNEWGQNVPVIILTNYDSDDEKLSKILKTHPSYYLRKSEFVPSEIVEKLQSVFIN